MTMKDEENVSILHKYKRNRAIQAKPFSHYLPLKLFNKETVLHYSDWKRRSWMWKTVPKKHRDRKKANRFQGNLLKKKTENANQSTFVDEKCIIIYNYIYVNMLYTMHIHSYII